jgi:uncharacterized cofD-like protein
VTLEAILENGKRVHGETKITASRSPIRKLMLVPRKVRPLKESIAAIREADLILIGPGSLYTSILPNLLIADIAQAIARSRAPRVYIANLMTQPGETTNYSVAEHLRAIQEHVKPRIIDYVVANRQKVSPAVARRYRREGAAQVPVDSAGLRDMGVKVLLGNLLDEHDKIRHNSARLARLLLDEFLPRAAAE